MINFLNYIPIILKGWFVVFLRIVNSFLQFYLEKKNITKILFITILMQFVFASKTWFYYSIQLTEIKEIIYVSSKSNLYFIFGSLFCFISCFFENKKLILLSLAVQILVGIFFIFGDTNPNLVHIDFLLKSDYFNSNSYLIYPVLLIINSILLLFSFI